jgi:hypothetical protein
MAVLKRSDILEDSMGKILLLFRVVAVVQVVCSQVIEKPVICSYNQVHE